jgi:hypothetical protein
MVDQVETAQLEQMVKTQFFLLSLLLAVVVEVQVTVLVVKLVALVVVEDTQIAVEQELLVKVLQVAQVPT